MVCGGSYGGGVRKIRVRRLGGVGGRKRARDGEKEIFVHIRKHRGRTRKRLGWLGCAAGRSLQAGVHRVKGGRERVSE